MICSVIQYHLLAFSFCCYAERKQKMPRRKERQFNGNRPIRKSEFDPQRESFMDGQGNYVYCQWVEDEKGGWKLKPVAQIPVSDDGTNADWSMLLDDMDCEIDRQNNLIRKNCVRDPAEIQEKICGMTEETGDSEAENSLDALLRKLESALNVLNKEQINLIELHMGRMMKLEEIRRAETEATGKIITKQAMYNRWAKIIRRLRKELDIQNSRKEEP